MTPTLVVTMLFLQAEGPSRVIFPEQALPIRFSHTLHLKKNIACTYCHEKAPESLEARDFLIPPEEACTDCHPIDRAQPFKVAKVAARCDACHPGWQGQGPLPRVSVPTPHLKFNHKVHVSGGIECQRCHGDMTKVELATRAQLPRMALCLRCHVGGTKAPSRCGTCHLLQPAGTLQVEYAEGKLAPSGAIRGDEHTPSFRKDHANVARNDEGYCLNCHRKDECLSCHNGVVKPFDFHGNDYVSIHSIDARRDSIKCQACHRLQTFCVGCHQRVGVAQDVSSGLPTGTVLRPIRFHPDGWVLRQGGQPLSAGRGGGSFRADPNHHAWQAQRNIRACAACHREQTCLECHASTSLIPNGAPQPPGWINFQGTNPHPPNWTQSGKCRTLAAHNKRVCFKCHGLADSQALGCVPFSAR